MKFFVVLVVASALGQLSIQNVAGQECDAETYASLVETFLGSQTFVVCVFVLAENYTLQNQNEMMALTKIASYNQRGFDALDQGNCSALNASLLGIVDASYYFGYTLQIDSSAIRSGLYDAYLRCTFPNKTCDINYLNASIYFGQYAVGCYLTLANGSYQLTEDQAELLNLVSALNDTAIYAVIANQCDTLNDSNVQLLYTLRETAELIYNGSDTNVSDALTMCLFPEPPCSIEDLNATLSENEPVLDCLCDLESYFNLTDPESEMLDYADKAYVNACYAVEEEDNCTVVSDDIQLFIDAIQEFIDYATGSNESSAEYVNAVDECANLSSIAA